MIFRAIGIVVGLIVLHFAWRLLDVYVERSEGESSEDLSITVKIFAVLFSIVFALGADILTRSILPKSWVERLKP